MKEKWLGKKAKDRFAAKRKLAVEQYDELLDESELKEPITKFLNR